MRILVTGATGFIGRHVVRHLVGICGSRHEIIATSTSRQKARRNDWYDEIEFIPCDLFKSKIDFYNELRKPDVVVHLAWQGFPQITKLFHIEENLFKDYHFIKKMVSGGVKRFLISGTAYEYGLQNGILSEESPTAPYTSYGVAKDALHKMLTILRQNLDFSLCWMRLFNVYGDFQNNETFLAKLVAAIDAKEKIFNMSGGQQIRDFIPVAEGAQKITALALNEKANGVFNICSGIPTTLRSFAEKVVAQKNADIKLNFCHYPYPDYEPMEMWGDTTKYNQLMNETK